MFVARKMRTEHKDLIHDVAYDFYGTRMATCSSDQTVRIWELDPSTGTWASKAAWKAHSGSVWKVTWANPEYGQVIATCSFDRTAAVWEEVVGEVATGERGGTHTGTHWVKRTTLVDSRTSVTDVKFGPKYLGLMLATCSADGFVRIYEAPDVMNLTQWSLQHEISVKASCSSLAWNPTYPRHYAPILAVGSDDPTPDTPKVFIYEFNENGRRWARVEALTDCPDPVNDLAFAPNLGRTYHMLAVASKDLKLFSFDPLKFEEEPSGRRLAAHHVLIGTDHNSPVWRVAWNVTGTMVASSGDDGRVRMWKGNLLGTWRCVSILKGDGSQSEPGPATEALPSTTSTPSSRYLKLGPSASNKDVVWH